MNKVSKVSVAVIGAGPYALSLSAHLQATGISHQVFGKPMQFWEGIAAAADDRFLKSFCFGTSLGSPKPGLTFADYNRPRGLETFEPCSMANFTEYGQWFQKQAILPTNTKQVTEIKKEGTGFQLRFDDGSECVAARVVVATGLAGCANIPPEFAEIGSRFVSHTSEIRRFSNFSGRRVAVIGAGQSALEAAALLHESGADVRLLVRGPAIKWNFRTKADGSFLQRLRSPLSHLGSGPIAWLLSNYPGALSKFPQRWRTTFVRRHLPATGAWWLRDRVEGVVPADLDTTAKKAYCKNECVILQCEHSKTGNTQNYEVDHVVLGTGFALKVERLQFIHPALQKQIDQVQGSPRLDKYFQSNVNGLYFIGPMSAMSFGPLFRFVAGADYTARIVSAFLGSAGEI